MGEEYLTHQKAPSVPTLRPAASLTSPTHTYAHTAYIYDLHAHVNAPAPPTPTPTIPPTHTWNIQMDTKFFCFGSSLVGPRWGPRGHQNHTEPCKTVQMCVFSYAFRSSILSPCPCQKDVPMATGRQNKNTAENPYYTKPHAIISVCVRERTCACLRDAHLCDEKSKVQNKNSWK